MKSMHTKRQMALLNKVQQQINANALLMMVPNNIYYYTGFQADPHERFFALFIDADTRKSTLFVPALDETAAQANASVDEIVPILDTDDAYKQFVQKTGVSYNHITVEKSYMTVMQMEQLKKHFAPVKFSNMEDLINEERAQKSPEEIEHVQAAVSLSEQALKNTWNQMKVGMTELEIKAELEYQMNTLGADAIAFETIVLSGTRSALPHGSASDIEVEHGDFVLFDFGATKNGYHSDLTRTCIMGEGTAEQQKIYQTVREANEQAIKAVKSGTTLKQIDLAARQVIEDAGYGKYFTHRIGHGLGLDVHEYPSIHHENTDYVEEGLLFTVEPGIYVPHLGGVRIEDDIYVQPDGQVHVLSSFSKELIYI